MRCEAETRDERRCSREATTNTYINSGLMNVCTQHSNAVTVNKYETPESFDVAVAQSLNKARNESITLKLSGHTNTVWSVNDLVIGDGSTAPKKDLSGRIKECDPCKGRGTVFFPPNFVHQTCGICDGEGVVPV